MLTDRERLARQRAQPLLIQLHRALSRLTSVITVMNTGAHPDDEQSGMLAVLRFGYGMRVIIACSTRGEGGQNSLGPERSAALGVLRTRELEEAARTLDADVVWLGHGPDDPVHDFGFSKDGADTLARWGRDRIVERLVRAYRSERPDIVIPTFLDVPGQHGHHRAMTETAEAAIRLAAYPAYVTAGLEPWSVAKYYLPAWSGGGGTYDDEVPPPSPSLRVSAPGRDAATGAAFEQIGEWSRASHASQGMGHWRPVPQTSWPLHLELGPAGPERDIRDNLPADLGQLADRLSQPAAGPLRTAQSEIEVALRAFPDPAKVTAALLAAAAAVETAIGACAAVEIAAEGHRLRRKLRELDAALLLANGVVASAWAEPRHVAPGGRAALNVQVDTGDGVGPVTVTPAPAPAAGLTFGASSTSGGVVSHSFEVAADAPLSTPFPPGFSSLGGNGQLAVRLQVGIGSRDVTASFDLEEPFAVVPAHSVSLDPDAVVIAQGGPAAPIPIEARATGGSAELGLRPPEGWQATRTAAGFSIARPARLENGRYSLPVLAEGKQAFDTTPIAYPHVGRTQYSVPLALGVLALDLALPAGARVGYVGGGSDRVGLWLRRMGLDVTDLDAGALAGDLGRYTSIVVGIFAFGLRPDLAAATERLHRWVESGGHLTTLYHRPSDGWSPDTTPPRRLVIGTPSLRWRVTNPHAEVEMLLPGHPLLAGPNRIGPEDWAGWDKERGLYFAAEWDDAYEPLLEMHDIGDTPLTGALLSGRIGKGRHTHTSLVLHHQLDRLVPGAFRLLANLVQPADGEAA